MIRAIERADYMVSEARGLVELIDFHGMEVEAVTDNGTPFANLRRLCEELGLDYGSQFRRLKASHWAVIVNLTTTGKDGKRYEMAFLSADSIPMWLATIRANSVAQDVRPKLTVLQLEIRDALYQHFGGDSSAISVNGLSLQRMNERLDNLQGQVAGLIQQMASQQSEMMKLWKEMMPIVQRIDDRTKGKREDVKSDDKRRLIACVHKEYGGMCPCCRRRQIVDGNGKRVPDVSQIDHYHHRSMAQLEYVWLVCKTCNRKLRQRKPGEFWFAKSHAFHAFQEILHEDHQMKLFA